ncbi:PAS domain S-box protein [Roseomonas sp. KE2513]|uniref:PAS domain S-box protein n=1 Tax=Roseomonas sp. KE2513 TaxID=2479202 RepID=UPI0018E059E3|nr:PAS domain S-box protein [Roseomonas sp. KE2513]
MAKQDAMMRRQRVLADFGDFVLDHEDLDAILTEGCRLIAGALGTDLAKVMEIDRATNTGFVRAGVGWRPGIVGHEHVSLSDRSSEAYAIEKTEPVITNDIAHEVRFEFPSFLHDHGVVALVNVPILLPGRRPWGVLQVDAREPREFGQKDIEFLKTYSMVLGPVIDRLRVTAEREQARNGLTEREERLTRVLDGMGEGFGLLAPDFTILEHNHEALRLDGRPRDEVVGRSHWEVYPGSEQSEVGRLLRKAMAERVPVSLEHQYAWDQGRSRWLEMRAFPAADGASAVFWRDVTDRRRAEDALRESEKRYRALFESMDEAYAVVEVLKDDGGRWADFRFLEVNPAFLEHTAMPWPVGKTASELLGTPNPRWTQFYGQALDTGRSIRVEEDEPTLGRTFDLNIFTLDRDRNRVAVLFTNITERKRTEAALRGAMERQAFLLTLGDAMRAQPGAQEMVEIACRLLGERLDASRIMVAEFDEGRGLAHIFHGWFADGATPFPTVMRLADYEGPILRDLRAGRTVRIENTGPPFERTDLEAIAELGVKALLSVPLIVEGRLVVNVSVHQHAVRRWTEGEIELVREVAERLWADLVRVRAEAALRESENRFRAFAENSADVIWIVSADGRRLEYLSPAFERMFGEDRAKITADLRRWAELVHPEDRVEAMRAMPRALAGEMAIVHYRVLRPSDGRVVHLRDTGFPIRDEAGGIAWIGGIVQDVTDIHDATAALEAQKERFQTLAEGIPQLVWRSRDAGQWTWASPQWQDYTGQSDEESHGLGWLDAVHPEDGARTMAAWHAARRHGQLDVEHRVRRASDGAWRWHQTRSLPVRNGPTAEQPEGRIVEWLGTTTDIGDLKRLQGEQTVLVAELQHRTRNLLGVVRNVARRSIPPQPGRDEYDRRLAALGRVQGFLARSSRYRVALRDLVEAEIQAAGDDSSDRVTVEGPPVDLPGEGAQPVALALHELATNAVKYGAIAQPTGRLSVTWRVEDAEDGARLVIAWRESGVAMPDGPPVRRGYGSELITRALPYQMRAETALEFTPDGVRCSISLPAGAFRVVEEVGS